MNTKTSSERKSVTRNLSLSKVSDDRLREMADYWGIASSEVVRRGLDEMYDKMQRAKFGYKGAVLASGKLNKEAKQLQREEQIQSIRAMSAQELQSHLELIGYFALYNLPSNIYNEIVESNAGVTWVQKTVAPDGNIISRREVFNLEEIIGDLKKNKLI